MTDTDMQRNICEKEAYTEDERSKAKYSRPTEKRRSILLLRSVMSRLSNPFCSKDEDRLLSPTVVEVLGSVCGGYIPDQKALINSRVHS